MAAVSRTRELERVREAAAELMVSEARLVDFVSDTAMIRVDTSRYEFARGRKPRGRGSWTFFIDDDPEPFRAYGRFRKCLDDALRLAVARGARVVKVGS